MNEIKHYSMRWALGIVEQMANKHARATKLVCALYAIVVRDLAAYLARNDPVFNYLRNRIKYWSNDILYRDSKYFTPEVLLYVERSAVARWAPEFAEKRLLARLTMVENLGMLQELVLKGILEDVAKAKPERNPPESTFSPLQF